jgi:hypothetical protein
MTPAIEKNLECVLEFRTLTISFIDLIKKIGAYQNLVWTSVPVVSLDIRTNS